MALGTTRLVMANQGAVTIELPTSHGSMRMLYAPFADLRSEGRGCGSGEKMSRKVASAFRCRTVTDIAIAVYVISMASWKTLNDSSLRSKPVSSFGDNRKEGRWEECMTYTLRGGCQVSQVSSTDGRCHSAARKLINHGQKVQAIKGQATGRPWWMMGLTGPSEPS